MPTEYLQLFHLTASALKKVNKVCMKIANMSIKNFKCRFKAPILNNPTGTVGLVPTSQTM